MSVPVPPLPCYLVEWYRPGLPAGPLERTAVTLKDSAASVCARGTAVQLLNLLLVPTDDVVFGIFTADSADSVAETCERAGVPAQRLTAAVGTQIE
jgi:hypothetical protein